MREEFYILLGMIWGLLLMASVAFLGVIESYTWAWVFFVPILWSVSIVFLFSIARDLVLGVLQGMRLGRGRNNKK